MEVSSTGSKRLPVGQLLGNLVRLFRAELAARGASLDGVAGIRPAHLQVFGAIKADGTRLTDLANSSSLSLSSMSELVDDLQRLGYLERRPDPADGRAKLVCLTDEGWEAIRGGRRIIEEVEADWGRRLGPARFESVCQALQTLIDELNPLVTPSYVEPPAHGGTDNS